MASIDRIARHPPSRKSCIQSTPEHACGQFWFGGKDDLFWHIGCSTTIRILCPTLGQIQFAIHKGMVSLAGIGQKDPDLAVFNASCRPTVLSLHSDRLLPFLEKARDRK